MASNEAETNCGCLECERCGSIVLRPDIAKMVELADGIFLPPMKKAEKDGDTVSKFWHILNMHDFENVGFCNTKDGIKYLVCADCEVGPIGAHYIKDAQNFYVAPSRVKHNLENTKK